MNAASVLVIASLLTTLGYALWVRVKPFKTCRRCHGHGICPRAIRRPARAAARLLADAKSEAKR